MLVIVSNSDVTDVELVAVAVLNGVHLEDIESGVGSERNRLDRNGNPMLSANHSKIR